MKKTKEDKMRFFFTSDLWLGRNNIIDIFDRPFADVNEMDSTLIENWNTTVGTRDIVFVLGNLAYDSTKMQKILTELNGVKVLMLSESDKNIFRSDELYVDELTLMQDIYEIDFVTNENNAAIYNNFGFLTSDEILAAIANIAYKYRPNVIILKNSIVDFAKYGITLSLYPLLEWNAKAQGTINIHGGISPSSKDLDKDCRFSVRTDFWGFRPVELSDIFTLVRQLKNK